MSDPDTRSYKSTSLKRIIQAATSQHWRGSETTYFICSIYAVSCWNPGAKAVIAKKKPNLGATLSGFPCCKVFCVPHIEGHTSGGSPPPSLPPFHPLTINTPGLQLYALFHRCCRTVASVQIRSERRETSQRQPQGPVI